MAVVIAVVYTIQFVEDAVLRCWQESLELSRRTPDIWAVGASDGGLPELFSTFIEQMLPSFDDQRLAEVVPAAPSSRGGGDPQFKVNGGSPEDVIETKNQEHKLQQTFMSQGWFVSRTQQADGTLTVALAAHPHLPWSESRADGLPHRRYPARWFLPGLRNAWRVK